MDDEVTSLSDFSYVTKLYKKQNSWIVVEKRVKCSKYVTSILYV